MRARLWAVALCGVLAGPAAKAQTPLLRNGGFESAAGWSLSEGTSLDPTVAHSGGQSLRIRTQTGAVAEQLVYGVVGGQVVSLSGWVKTADIAPAANGGFAFVAVYQYDTTGRLAQYKDYVQLAGTHDWTPVTATLQVAPGAEYVAVRAGVFNASGTAWFDDLNLTLGSTPVPWSEPAGASAHSLPYRAAILDDPGFPVRGFRTPTATFRQALRAEGVSLTSLDARAIADPTRLNADAFDLLVVPTGASFPVTARQSLIGFLLRGGHLLCSGGYAFDDLQVPDGNGWTPYTRHMAEQRERARDPRYSIAANGGFEDGAKGWEPTSATQCTIVDESPFAGKKCGKVTAGAVDGGARWGLTLPVEPGKSYLATARMRIQDVRGSGFAFLAVYQYGPDGKLVAFADFAQKTGTRDWTRYEYPFQVAPGAAKVHFYGGLYMAAGSVWIDEVTCAPLPAEERINAHFGEPGDGLTVAPTQLTIFSPDQPLTGTYLALAPLAYFGMGKYPTAPVVTSPVQGYEATAQLRQNARWSPLLWAHDAFIRPSGVAGALVTNFAGPFTGGRWAIFGVTNRDVFAGSEGAALLRRTLRLLRSGVSLQRVSTPYATFKRGETAEISIDMANDSRERRDLTLRLHLHGEDALMRERPLGSDMQSVQLAPGEHRRIAIPIRVGSALPDFVIVRADLHERSEFLDEIETGFCVYDEKTMTAGRRITYRDNGFDLAQRGSKPGPLRATLFGTDTYGNMFGSRSCSPLTWYRDAQEMRNAGLHMYENLQFTPPDWTYTEAQWRQFDGIIQISQHFGLPYMAGLLIGQEVVVDDATLAKQAEMCRQFAARYKNVPGLLYYLNGDFVLNLKDLPDIRRIWNDLLRERYGSDEVLRKAWGARAPKEALGQIPVQDATPDAPFDVRARDVGDLKITLIRRWVNAHCAAIRTEDETHPITSEYYQRPYGAIDCRLSIGDQDAANIGYFDAQPFDITRMLATIKWNDMRAAGKTVNMGEYGVKTHDAWSRQKSAPDYHVARTDREMRRLFWYVAHAAWALDVTKIQNWCWSDDPDNIFPWGMAYQNPLRLKPAGKLLRNLRLFSDLVGHTTRTEPVTVVMPDTWRHGAPELVGNSGLANALQCMLATNVPFDVANLAQVERLPEKPARVIVLPFANALQDHTVDALLRMASAGWRIYLSGDVSLRDDGSHSSERLDRLTGGGVRVENPLGVPLTRKRIGQGAIWNSPQTWESLTGHDLFGKEPGYVSWPAHNLYIGLLPKMGVKPSVALTTTGCRWLATETPVSPPTPGAAPGRRLVAAFPLTTKQTGPVQVLVRTSTGEYRWSAEEGWPCAAIVSPTGEPIAATGGRGGLGAPVEVSIGSSSPWMAVALDNRPIISSSAIAIAQTDGGEFRWRSRATSVGATIVEWRDGQAVAVAPASIRRTGDHWSVRCPANDLILVCRPADRGKWLKELSRR